MSARALRVGKIVGCIFIGACPIVTHVLLATSNSATLAIIVSAFQVFVLGAIITTRSAHKYKWLVAAVAAVLFSAIVWCFGQYGLFATSGLPFVVAYIGLLMVFGGSLLPGREALITGLARRIHGTLWPGIPEYTRRVTIAWCFFFAAQLTTSLLLFLFAPMVVWSFFVNVLDLPLIALMFGGEYLYRVINVPNRPHSTIPQVVRAFMQRNTFATKRAP
jgi:uncharacterized membrane protein